MAAVSTRGQIRGGGESPGPPLIEVRNLVKRFGSVIALGGVSMKVHAGEVLCLLENYTQALAYTARPAATTAYQHHHMYVLS